MSPAPKEIQEDPAALDSWSRSYGFMAAEGIGADAPSTDTEQDRPTGQKNGQDDECLKTNPIRRKERLLKRRSTFTRRMCVLPWPRRPETARQPSRSRSSHATSALWDGRTM